MTRRQILASTTLATAATQMTSAQSADKMASSPKLEKGAVILFQGDSITDAGRSRKHEGQASDQNQLGRGYPLFAASGILGTHPDLALEIHNRGISGHKVPDLQKRWKKDAIDLKPNVLSILIGVNDIWHKLNGNSKGTVESYHQEYDQLLTDTKKALPDTTLVICEPFVLKTGSVNDRWFPEFDERREVAHKLAKAHGTLWVPFQKMFDDVVAQGSEPGHWAHDGVHPSFAGHSLMASTWRKVVGI